MLFSLNAFGVGVSCRNLYSFVVYSYVNGPVIMWFLFGEVPLPLGAWDGLRYFIMALPEPSI